MITDGEKWHYLTVRSLSALLHKITSNHDGDFYCFNCFHSIVSIKNHPGVKSMRAPYAVFSDIESFFT